MSTQKEAAGWTDELTVLHEETAGSDHYMDRASRLQAIDALRRWMPGPTPRVLDVGCSSGFFLKNLRRSFPHANVIGGDFVFGPLPKVKTEGFEVVQFDLVRSPLRHDSLDAVVLLNVLEHIEDDHAAMACVSSALRPGGVAYIEVPANPGLYDLYDRQLRHFRRYTMNDLVGLTEHSGLDIVERFHIGTLIYPAFWLVKKRNRLRKNVPKEKQELIVARANRAGRGSRVAHAILQWERCLPRPFGIRCVVVAKKR